MAHFAEGISLYHDVLDFFILDDMCFIKFLDSVNFARLPVLTDKYLKIPT